MPGSGLSRAVSLDDFGSTGPTPVGYAPTALGAPVVPLRPPLVGGFSLARLVWVLPLASRRARAG